jgi:hypothetical protein
MGWLPPSPSPLHLLLAGVTMEVGSGVAGPSRGAMVVLQEALVFLAGDVTEVAGVGFLHAHERVAEVVQSGESPHR